jgi:hypothetical protein
VRNNGAFEAMALSSSGNELVVMTETPLFQDGPEATFDQGGIVRIALYDVKSKNRVKEFTYKIDPVHKRTLPIKKFSINGAVEIVSITEDRYIVMERSFSVGHKNDIRLYEIDLSEAKNKGSKEPVDKKLILNLKDVNVLVDNIEGLTFGKNFEDGRRSLILVSDDNFRGGQKTQFLVFAVSGLY